MPQPKTSLRATFSLLISAVFAAGLPSFASADEGAGQLATGYISTEDTMTFTQCLNGSVATHPATEVPFKFNAVQTLTELNTLLQIESEGEIQRKKFSFGDSAKQDYELTSNDYTHMVVYHHRYLKAIEKFTPLESGPVLNELGQQGLESPTVFINMCGDKFIATRHQGGDLFIAVYFHFNSMPAKNAFIAANGADLLNMSSAAMLMQNNPAALHNVQGISFYGWQLGGQLGQLSGTFGSPQNLANEHKCSMGDFQACSLLLASLNTYAQTTFVEQLKGNPDASATLAYEFQSYEQLGINVSIDTNIDSHVLDARWALANNLDDHYAHLRRAKRLIHRLPTYDAHPKFYSTIETTIASLERNIQQLKKAGLKCFSPSEDCLAIQKAAFASLESYNEQALLEGPRAPFYRLFDGKDHRYETHCDALARARNSYRFEGVMGYVLKYQPLDAVPLYRYYNRRTHNHFYTTSWRELGNGRHGFIYQGIEGYVHKTPSDATQPLYRYFSNKGNHFYTKHYSELGAGTQQYKYEGIQAYLFKDWM